MNENCYDYLPIYSLVQTIKYIWQAIFSIALVMFHSVSTFFIIIIFPQVSDLELS